MFRHLQTMEVYLDSLNYLRQLYTAFNEDYMARTRNVQSVYPLDELLKSSEGFVMVSLRLREIIGRLSESETQTFTYQRFVEDENGDPVKPVTCTVTVPPIRYQVGAQIGQGAYATVYQATDPDKPAVPLVLRMAPSTKKDYSPCVQLQTREAKLDQGYIEKYGHTGAIVPYRDTFTSEGQVSMDGQPDGTATVFMSVMDRWDLSLNTYMQTYPDDFKRNRNTIRNRLIELNRLIMKTGVVPGDAHSANVVLKLDVDRNVTDVKSIDIFLREPRSGFEPVKLADSTLEEPE